MIEHFELKIERKERKEEGSKVRFSSHEFFSNNVAKFWGRNFEGAGEGNGVR